MDVAGDAYVRFRKSEITILDRTFNEFSIQGQIEGFFGVEARSGTHCRVEKTTRCHASLRRSCTLEPFPYHDGTTLRAKRPITQDPPFKSAIGNRHSVMTPIVTVSVLMLL
jgi:hypothetical protein